MKKFGLELTGRPKRLPHVVWKTLEDETLFMNTDNGTYFSTNAVGLAIWQACDGKRSWADIAAQVAAHFKTPVKKVIKDTKQFLSRLEREDLVDLPSVKAS